MQLEGQKTLGAAGLFIIVDKLHGLFAINKMNKFVILRFNAILVPLFLFYSLANLLGVSKFLSLLL